MFDDLVHSRQLRRTQVFFKMKKKRLYIYLIIELTVLFSSVVSELPEGRVGLGGHLAPPRLWPIKSTLYNNVSLEFNFTGIFTRVPTRERRLQIYLYENQTSKILYEKSEVISSNLFETSVPCQTFSHPGIYIIKYRITDGTLQTLRKTVAINWNKISIVAPVNHKALNGHVPVIVYHNRNCLPEKYHDEVQAFWLESGNKPRLIASRPVRKIIRGRQKDSRKRLRFVFPCELFDYPGMYYFEYKTGYDNSSLARSKPMNVFWGEYSLYSPSEYIFPCSVTLPISFTSPFCHTADDYIEVYEQETGNFVTRDSAIRGFTTLFFPCDFFQRHIEGYCFKYVSNSKTSGKRTVKATFCLPSTFQGIDEMTGWSAWTSWGQCSVSCGKGRRHRYKVCHAPKQSPGDEAKVCPGSPVDSEPCSLKECPVIIPPCECGCTLTDPEGMVSSSPRLFTSRKPRDCTWLINVPSKQRVKLWFDVIRLSGDWIVIRDGNNSTSPILRTLKGSTKPKPIISSRNQMYLKFHSVGKKENSSRRGFSASYRAIDQEANSSSYGNKATEIVAFAGIFALTVVILATIFFIVYKKIKHKHKESNSPSSRSSCTSDTTVRSTQTDEPAIRKDKDIECAMNCHASNCPDATVYEIKRCNEHDIEMQDLAFCEPGNIPPYQHKRKQYKHKRKHKRKPTKALKNKFAPYNNDIRVSDVKYNSSMTDCPKLKHSNRSPFDESLDINVDQMTFIDPSLSYPPGILPYMDQAAPIKLKKDHKCPNRHNDITREKSRTREKKSIKEWDRNTGSYTGLRQVVI